MKEVDYKISILELSHLKTQKYLLNQDHCTTIERILIIEDSPLLLQSIAKMIEHELHIECHTASSEQEATLLLKQNDYDLVIIDIYLPDSSGNFIGYLVRKKHRIIIITASNDDIKREKLVSLPIIDYLLKTDEKSILNYLASSIRRIQKNALSPVMICDDSQLSRLQVKKLIIGQNLPYIETKDGQEAYESLLVDKIHVSLLITDVMMPRMDGINLIRNIRHTYSSNELPILALSSSDKPTLVAQLLKTGANDYISKPINNEEFLTRLNISLDQSRLFAQNKQLIEDLKLMSETDFLTKLYNRNYFYRAISLIQTQAKRHKQYYGVIILDIDYFKKVNDTYGHETGDTTLVTIAKILLKTARESDILCRWGGEEFLILVPNTNKNELFEFAQRIRLNIQNTSIETSTDSLTIQITASMGISIANEQNVDNADNVIFNADQKLYQAKKQGRNCVVI